MKTVYFREGQHYSSSNIESKFGLDTDKAKALINILKQYNVLKAVRRDKPEYSDLSDQDIIAGEIPDNSPDFTYQFTFVGVILLNNNILLVYPKYIDNNKEPFDELKTIIKVLEKYNQKEQLVHLYNGDAESKVFNKLAISLHILNDYYENGLYSNQQEIIEQNGEGEILWDKTINETYAIIKNNTPYYVDLFTVDNTENDLDYIRRLHAAIVTKCTRDLNDEKLLDLFDVSGAELTEQTVEDFGDKDYICYRLEQEIKTQFVTRKQNLLKTLYTYISEQSSNETDVSFSLYGTNSFNLVWEKACGSLFNNMLDGSWTIKRLKNAGLIDEKRVLTSDMSKTISDYIERPEWILFNNSVNYKGDLIPDMVMLKKTEKKGRSMFILDGKYYLIREKDGELEGNPGIQDVIKQYIYNAALRDFINIFDIKAVANAFVVPAIASKKKGISIENIGQISYWAIQKAGFKELPDVQVVMIDPELVWDRYLSNKPLSETEWDKLQLAPVENYLAEHEKSDSVPSDSKLALVGYMRDNYFDFIKDKDEFIFYFYATGEKNSRYVRYPLHPYIDSCSVFIGFRGNKEEFVAGKLEMLPIGRCNIIEVSADRLETELGEQGYQKTSSGAWTYYKVLVKKCSLSEITGQPIDKAFIETKIGQNGLNKVLFSGSPRVIEL